MEQNDYYDIYEQAVDYSERFGHNIELIWIDMAIRMPKCKRCGKKGFYNLQTVCGNSGV